MANRKILFINPVSRGYGSLSTDRRTCFPPIGLLMMAALTPPEWEARLIDENFDSFAFQQADLVALSAMTATINRAYEIAAVYRKRGIPVILGGIHASVNPEEALNFVDTVVVGEGESVWKNLMSDFQSGKLKELYRGERVSLTNLPFPRRDLLSSRYSMGSIQTARGCPYNCAFCSVTLFNGGTYRARPVTEVVEELRTIKQKIVFFVDDNIIGPDDKARVRAGMLFDAIIQGKVNKLWLGQSTIDCADDEKLIRKAYESGCRIIFIGLESINEKSLGEMGKRMNLEKGVEHYKQCIKRFHNQGISVWGNFILGNDSDDHAVFKHTEEFILGSGIDLISFSCLTPLPGTRLFERLDREGRIICRNYPQDWDKYSFTEVVFKPKHMTPQELDLGIRAIAGHVFSRFRPERTLVRSLRENSSFTSSLMAYSMNRAFRKTAKLIMAEKEKQWCSHCSRSTTMGITP